MSYPFFLTLLKEKHISPVITWSVSSWGCCGFCHLSPSNQCTRMDFQFKKEPEAVFRRIKMRKKLPLCEMIDLVVGVDCDRMDPKPEPVIYLQVKQGCQFQQLLWEVQKMNLRFNSVGFSRSNSPIVLTVVLLSWCPVASVPRAGLRAVAANLKLIIWMPFFFCRILCSKVDSDTIFLRRKYLTMHIAPSRWWV